jgi:DNA (cytosine-5)-methyltransferase 1
MQRTKTIPAKAGRSSTRVLRNVGLFAGIGGIEQGLHLAGHVTELICEIDPAAQAVLSARFPSVPLVGDIRDLASLPEADIISAGFPCQDLSQAGKTAGIRGRQSGVVEEVFRLAADFRGRWLFFENVPFMLQLQKGKAMQFLTGKLEELGFAWAYRTVDAQCFGLPQRRQRVLLLASRSDDPREILLVEDAAVPPAIQVEGSPCGFYWTEGNKGLGWAVDAVPTLKGGSTIGIPSPPAIWMRHADGRIVQPEIRDAERLQGFDPDWTLPAVDGKKRKAGLRWKLVGNAVSVPVARWVGDRLEDPRKYDETGDKPLGRNSVWPRAAWGRAGEAYAAGVSVWPVVREYQHLAGFLRYPTTPLSERATAGFLGRAQMSCLRFAPGFLDAVATHLRSMRRPDPGRGWLFPDMGRTGEGEPHGQEGRAAKVRRHHDDP